MEVLVALVVYPAGFYLGVSEAAVRARTNRLVEKGVRMVQVYYAAGDPWDAHGDLKKNHDFHAGNTDQPSPIATRSK